VHDGRDDRGRGRERGSWLATRRWAWLTPQRLHRITLALVVTALVASATILSGSS